MRLIDADALKASYVVTSTTTNSLCHLYVSIEDINSAPTIDAVSVVRCSECRWSRCVFYRTYKAETGYCDIGEREGE